MFQILLIFIGVIGGILAFLSKAQNLLLFFGGLGLVFLSVVAYCLRKHARILLFPFIILLWGLLYFLNTLDFRPNILIVDFLDSGSHATSVIVGENEYPLGGLLPPITGDPSERIGIKFQKPPILQQEDFILSNLKSFDDRTDLFWFWSGESQWQPISEAEYLHIYDPLLNIYYPDAQTALLLVDRLEFRLLDISNRPIPAITTLGINDLFYATIPGNLIYNSPIQKLSINDNSNEAQPHFVVRVNEELLNWESSSEGWQYFSFNEDVYKIDTLQIIDRSQPHPITLFDLEPTFSFIYVIEEEPAPIMIEKISIQKIFGRLNLTVPIYEWDTGAIMADFDVTNGDLTLINDSVHLTPGGFQTTITLNRPLAPIISQAVERLSLPILWGNIIITTSMILGLVIMTGILNRFSSTISLFSRIITKSVKDSSMWVKDLITKMPLEIRIRNLTPFKIFFFIFLILCWVIFFSITLNPFLLVVLLVLSGFLAYYVIMDLEFTRK